MPSKGQGCSTSKCWCVVCPCQGAGVIPHTARQLSVARHALDAVVHQVRHAGRFLPDTAACQVGESAWVSHSLAAGSLFTTQCTCRHRLATAGPPLGAGPQAQAEEPVLPASACPTDPCLTFL